MRADLQDLNGVAEKLLAKRIEGGMLSFQRKEMCFELNKERFMKQVKMEDFAGDVSKYCYFVRLQHGKSNAMVEELMNRANTTIA